MGRPGENAAKSENTDATAWEKSSLGSYNKSMGDYMSNVNAKIAAGNPYESQAYKQEQNLATSGAMHAVNDTAAQQMRDDALRTGENGASVQASIAKNARVGQQAADTFGAERDTANQDKYLAYEQGLMGDQLAGTREQAGMTATLAGQRAGATSALVNEDEQSRQMWESLAQDAAQAGGSAMAATKT